MLPTQMKRRLFNILSVLSLVLCAATVAMCVRSYWVADLCTYGLPQTPQGMQQQHSLFSFDGRIYYNYLLDAKPLADDVLLIGGFSTVSMPIQPGVSDDWRRQMANYHHGVDFAGFHFSRTDPTGTPQQLWTWLMVVPDWAVILLTMVFPTVWFVKQRRERRRNRVGLCIRCGYDLRASKERCPECGTPIPVQASEKPKQA